MREGLTTIHTHAVVNEFTQCARSYDRAAAAIVAVPFRVSHATEIGDLKGISEAMLTAIDQYCKTGSIQELGEFKTSSQLRKMLDLTSAYGTSVRTARQILDVDATMPHSEASAVALNSRTVLDSEVRTIYNDVDWRTPVTSDEARQVAETVRLLVQSRLSCRLRVQVCGGFRRGMPSGHDVDIVYCHCDISRRDSVMDDVLRVLEDDGLVVKRLRGQTNTLRHREIRFNTTAPVCDYEHAHDLMLTIGRTSSGKAIRLDLVGVLDASEFAFATLAWSGTTLFQRELRRYATDAHGWVFSQHGLFDAATGKRVALNHPVQSEHDIFAALGLPYRPPFERCC